MSCILKSEFCYYNLVISVLFELSLDVRMKDDSSLLTFKISIAASKNNCQ